MTSIHPTGRLPTSSTSSALRLHEMGHALGFVSGIESYDYCATPGSVCDGPGDWNAVNWDERGVLTPLDMFRYSSDPAGGAPISPVLDMSVGTASFFSIDGGTALFGNAFSTGYNGDGQSVSHWRHRTNCVNLAGTMEPLTCPGQQDSVTSLDLATFDAMGFNLTVDVLAGGGTYRRSSAQIAAWYATLVPEPATWATMLAGFAMIAAALRRRPSMPPMPAFA
ncbi:NF038122 family metalloprotease [Sphingomonas sp. Tas61C01]|uniref:NF038122 family metalloprotease n=1 Tax=Sphingomonas sp. Tas61C01 TaxID=3458297 RepID=UPI00403E9532